MCSKRKAAAAMAAVMAVSVSACSTAAAANSISFGEADFTETTFTGMIESIENNTLTLSVRTADTEPGKPDGAQNGEIPSGESLSQQSGVHETAADAKPDDPPEKPEGDGLPPDGGSQNTPPENPEGDDSNEKPKDEATSAVPEKPGEGNTEPGREAPDTPENSGGTDSREAGTSDDGITVTIVLNDDSVLTDSQGLAVETEDLSEGDFLTVTLYESGEIESIVLTDNQNGGPAGGAPAADSSVSYTALTEITEDFESTGETYTSTGTDENAIYIHNGAKAALTDAVVTRNSNDSTGGDNSSFYGVGAAVLNTDGTAVIKGGTFTTDAKGGAGIFSYGDGITYVSDAVITTQQDTSGGIHVAGGGTLYAWDLDVETNGESSAAIRSDRGGGTIVADGGSYISNGVGSPAVYCTADIAINNAILTANGSEAVCIEGLNTLNLFDCELTGNMSDNEQNDCTWNIIVYQSMSGDSEVGNGTFSMTGGSITAQNGGMFYTTNTECTFYLSDVDITYADDNAFFLRCTGNNNKRGWGTSGANGSQCTFTADSQEMTGDIVYDSISTLDFYMENGSVLTGAVLDDETYAGNGGDGYCRLYISSDSKWVVTGDSAVTGLYSEGTIVDESGNTVTIVGTDGTVYVQGSSSCTVTVSEYSTSADMSGAAAGGSFIDYAAEK